MLARSDHDFVLEERRPRRGGAKRGARRWTAVFSTLFRNPGRTIVGATAAAVGVGILVNALALQGGPHPAPLFRPAPPPKPAPAQAAAPLPPARPAEKIAATPTSAPAPAATVAQEPASGIPLPPRIQRQPAAAPAAPSTTAGTPVPPAPIPNVPRDAIGDILKGGAPAPAAAVATAPVTPVEPDRTVLAVQRALNKLNYGPVKPDGLMGPGTRQAIERFERERKLPVTGEAAGRTARELAAASGIPVD